MANKEFKRYEINLELWCSWLSRLLYTQKVLGSNPSSSIFSIKSKIIICLKINGKIFSSIFLKVRNLFFIQEKGL